MNIALLGTGLMGIPLGERLLTAGHSLWIHNRTTTRAAPLVEHGASLAQSPAIALRRAEFVVLALSDAPAIRATLLSGEAREQLVGRTVIQMGTISPEESRELSAAIAGAGGSYLEAPVLGSIPEARAGTLIVMVGGEHDTVERALPVLECFGPEPLHVGTVGQAAALKLALNQLIGALTTSFGLSLALMQREGVAVDTFMEVLRESALYAPTFDKKLQRMLDGDFANPNFPVKHLLKDMRLFRQTARADGLDAGLAEAVVHLLERSLEQGLAEEDYSALFTTLQEQR